MRFNGDNQKVLWDAFARRGMGKGASTPNADSGDTEAQLRLAHGGQRPGHGSTRPGRASVYVGTTRPAPPRSPTPLAEDQARRSRRQFAPGSLQMLYVSAKRGFKRFTMTVEPGQGKPDRPDRRRSNLAAAATARR